MGNCCTSSEEEKSAELPDNSANNNPPPSTPPLPMSSPSPGLVISYRRDIQNPVEQAVLDGGDAYPTVSLPHVAYPSTKLIRADPERLRSNSVVFLNSQRHSSIPERPPSLTRNSSAVGFIRYSPAIHDHG
ncbi:hypothetical protein BLNAU_2208 [Blattamonas nauphoetae]|uniref:Uncharacterized protein n=1 Tax=Blattamonas nauphoetae TaxID=2049346 RepID=A0ABQ9YG83_9EUKA|nr:hypothetical protein BLNAU_2208 [Blattamonas nauphoetae]